MGHTLLKVKASKVMEGDRGQISSEILSELRLGGREGPTAMPAMRGLHAPFIEIQVKIWRVELSRELGS